MSSWFGDRTIDEWCDDSTLVAAGLMNQVAADLIVAAEEDVRSATWKDGLVAPSAFIAKRILPKIREAGEPVVERFLADANTELGRIVAHQAIWHRSPEPSIDSSGTFEGWTDVAVAVGPLAGGAAAAAAVPLAAITTTTAWFGLVTTTVVNWPVMVGGTAVAGIAIATGVLNMSRIRDKARVRLRKKARAFIIRAFLDGTPKEPSLFEQVSSCLRSAAEEAKRHR